MIENIKHRKYKTENKTQKINYRKQHTEMSQCAPSLSYPSESTLVGNGIHQSITTLLRDGFMLY